MGDLSEDFDSSEFRCKCGKCNVVNISPVLVKQLQRLRTIYRNPIEIDSGGRCPEHNKEVGGVPDSAHLMTVTEPCEAADIKIATGGIAYELIDIILTYRLFTRIGIDVKKGFMHLDVDKEKPQDWIWTYPVG